MSLVMGEEPELLERVDGDHPTSASWGGSAQILTKVTDNKWGIVLSGHLGQFVMQKQKANTFLIAQTHTCWASLGMNPPA